MNNSVMADIDENSQDVRRGQLLNELFDRRRRGHDAGSSSTLAGDNELAAEISTLARLAGDLEREPVTIPGLITRGTLERSADPSYPAKLGPYEIVSLIGVGGMGIVFKAIETRLRRTVALKILRPELIHDRGPLVRFEREARSAAALRHSNIVTVHAVGQHDGTPFIAMEYVSGPSLADVIRRGDVPTASSEHEAQSLTPDSIHSVFRQLLEALSAAHEAGLIHRDVKPSNILLVGTPQGAADPRILESSNPGILPTIKLADFGLARMYNSQTQLTLTQAVLGTPEYMSPEQARGSKDIDHRTDLYSAGVVLYEMLTGQTPFRADTPTATIHRILHEEPRDPRKLDKAADPVLASVALRLIEKRPAERFKSAGEVLEALKAGRAVHRAGVTRHHRLAKVILTAAMGLMAAAAMWWSTRGSNGEYIMLFNEDWPTDQIDADKWAAWGDPLPVLHDGRWKGAYSLDPGGDDWCPSGVNGLEKFDLRHGFRLSWSAIMLASEGERGSHDLSLLVGIASTRADGGICGNEGRKQKLITLFTVADVDDAYRQVGGDAVQGKQPKLPYERSEDAEWYRYTMAVDAQGRLTLTRGNEVLASASVDTALLEECVLVVEGRSTGRSGKCDIAVDDIDLMGRR